VQLSFVFAGLSFVQNFAEPTEGLPAQPVRSLLSVWGRSTASITGFAAVMAIPWLLKPGLGLLSDFVPIAGRRRQGYLILAGTGAAIVFLGLWAIPPNRGSQQGLLVSLTLATGAIAMCDVAADGLMVERGQRFGLTGRLQAVQWGATYAAGLLTGWLGGLLSERQWQGLAFLLCGLAGCAGVALAAGCVHEERHRPGPGAFREAIRALGESARSPTVRAVGAFLVLWNFNPFSSAVLHLHMTRALGFSEQFYGNSLSLLSLSSIVACVVYGSLARRLERIVMIHLSIGLGVVSSLAYLAMTDTRSAAAITFAIGFTYMTATLIQLDLAAQACPPAAAGTIFATLMACSNGSMALSTWAGGVWYDHARARWSAGTAFQLLVLIGSALTACCWLLVPVLVRGFAQLTTKPTPLDPETF
jgi:Na+/melibiose symporter-like transporter